MRHFLLGTAAVLAIAAATPAFAGPAQDAAYDKHANPVGDSNGKCVRTKWQDAADPCAIAPAPKPIPVAAPAPAPAPIPVVSLEQRTVYFAFDSAALTPEAMAKLDNLANIVNGSSAVSDVRIHGFTDQFGSGSYNLTLANKRATAVKSYLDSKSRLASTMAEVQGLGKSVPAEGCNAIKKRDEKISCMAQERRVEIELKAQVR
jgi:outer membrane protein OmpA-like peptidoglycan-associated protein